MTHTQQHRLMLEQALGTLRALKHHDHQLTLREASLLYHAFPRIQAVDLSVQAAVQSEHDRIADWLDDLAAEEVPEVVEVPVREYAQI